MWFLFANAAAFGARLGVTTGQWIDRAFLGGRRAQHPLSYRNWEEAVTDASGIGFGGVARVGAGFGRVTALGLAATFEFGVGRLLGTSGVPFVIPEIVFPTTTKAFTDMATAVMGIGVATTQALGALGVVGLETAWGGIQAAANEVLGLATTIQEEVIDPAIAVAGEVYAAVLAGTAWLGQWFGRGFRGLELDLGRRRLKELEEAITEALGTEPSTPGQVLGDATLFANRSFQIARIPVPETALVLQALKRSRS